jgi:Domain of unknown function (DUF4340)
MSTASGIRPRVIVIWLLLLALIGAIGFIQYRDRAAQTSDEPAPVNSRMLLPMSMDELGALEIFYAGALHRFERDQSGTWFYHAHGAAKSNDPAHAHQTDAAQAQTIAAAFKGLSRTHMEREFPRGNEAEYGLTAPEMFVLLYGKNTAQLLDKFTVGSLAPDNLSRYVLSNNYPKVVTIANYQIENLLNLLKAVGATPTAATK